MNQVGITGVFLPLIFWCLKMGENGRKRGFWDAASGGVQYRCKNTRTQTQFYLPIPGILCQTSRMKRLTTTLCLTIAVLLGGAGMSFALPKVLGNY